MPILTLRTAEHAGGGIEFVNRGGEVTGIKGVNIPNVIDAPFFVKNKTLLPIFRFAARHTLLVTEKPDITSHGTALKVVKKLQESPITQVGDVQTQRTDDGRTNNYVIPLTTNEGIIEVVVNGAWGVSWRLNKDHQLVKSHPSLGSCQPEDKSVETGKGVDKYNLVPEVLEQATIDNINPEALAGRIKFFISELINNQKKADCRYESSMRGLPYNYAGESSVMTFGPEILPDGNSNSFVRLKFDLGYKHGIKSITIDGSGGKDDKNDLYGLGNEAKEIGLLIDQFYPQRIRGKLIS